MKDAISTLKSEHRSMSMILRTFKELARMAQDPAVRPDWRVFHAMLYYIDKYPERLHHPKEDRFIFAPLAARSDRARRLVEELRSEHAAGARLVRDLERALFLIEETWPQGRHEFQSAVGDYAAFHWAHMRKEEEQLFPIAQRELSAEDRQAVNAAFAANTDPLAGLGERDFMLLFSRIALLAPAPVGLGEPWKKAAA